jgi:DNA-binding MarR family transcriptional regulator
VLRIAAGADRRVRNITVTPEGQALLEKAAPMWRDAQTRVIDKLGDERWGELLRQLQGVRRALQK